MTAQSIESFECYPFSSKYFHAQQKCFTDKHNKLKALKLTLKLVLFYYSCIYKFNYAADNVYLRNDIILKAHIPICENLLIT